MHYLAFDIEAANGYKPSSICSIGIVIADEQFNVVSRQNVWINPKTKYNLNGTRKNVGIDLHLDKKLLDSSPDFAGVYDKINKLLSDPNYLVMGHAVDADVRMLNAACERYNLPRINFSFICTQLLYKLHKGDKEVKALNKIAADMGVTYEEHNSEEDAYVSLLTLKYLAEQTGLTVDQLLAKHNIRKGTNDDFELVRPATLTGQLSKKQITQVAVEKIKKHIANQRKKNNAFGGKVFCLARSLEVSDCDQLYAVVEKIATCGGRYSSKLAKCNVYVLPLAESEQDVMRHKRIAELAEQGLVQCVTVQDILEGKL